MPEGPSIVILRDEAAKFRGKTVRRVSGNSKLELDRMLGRRVVSIRSWGKHFLMEFRGFSLRVHMLMFGSYRIDDHKPAPPRVSFEFDNGSLTFYASSLKYVEGDLDATYDWRVDVMNPDWDPALARRKAKAHPSEFVCDVLLDQDIFAGVGNIIKNEVLFRIRLHPLSTVGAMPAAKLRALVEQARQYSFDFLEWKKQYVLKKHWLAHAKQTCPRCDIKFSKGKLGRSDRRSFYCERCQKRYS